MNRLRSAKELYSDSGSATIKWSMSRCPSRSCLFRFLKAAQTSLSSPSIGLNALSGKPAAISSGVVPNRLFPTLMW